MKNFKKWQIVFGLTIAVFVSLGITAYSKKLGPIGLTKKYTDMHVHVACVSLPGNECFISHALMSSYKFGPYLNALGVTLEEMRTSNNQILIDRLAAKVSHSMYTRRAVLLGLDGYVNRNTGEVNFERTQIIVPNSFILAAAKKYPSLFLYGPSINPYRRNALELLMQAKLDGAVLIKWIPSTMNIDPADEKLIPFYQKLKELNLPLLVHSGHEETFVWADNTLSNPMRLKLALDHGVTVIAAHMATSGEEDGVDESDRLLELFQNPKYDHLLFADISANTQFNRIKSFLKSLRNPIYKNRLLNGTDWPLIEAKFLGVSLTPYHLYTSALYDCILRADEANKLDSYNIKFDQDLVLKKYLGVPDDVFSRADEVLHLPN